MKLTSKQWLVLIGCFLIQAIPYGLAQNVPPLYLHPIQNTYCTLDAATKLFTDCQGGFTGPNLGLYFTIGAVAAALVSPLIGKHFGKQKTQMLMLGGIVVSIIGMVVQAIAPNVYMLWLANVLIQIGCITFSGLAVPYLMGSWFNDNVRATAMGIAFAGGSVGNFFLQPIFTTLFGTVGQGDVAGLHRVFWIIAIVFAVIGILIVLFFIKDNKQDKTPNQDYNEQMAEAHKEDVAGVKGCGFAHTKSMPQFWLMGAAMFIIGLNIAAQSAQYNQFFNEINVDKAVITSVGSVFAIGCLLGNVMGGILFSKLGVFKTELIGGVFQIVSAASMLVLAFAGGDSAMGKILPFVWAILYGLSVFTYTSGPSVIIQSLFGLKDFGETVGMFNIFFAVGFALGTFVFQMINSSLGVHAAWISVVAYAVIGYVVMLINVKTVEAQKLAEK